MEEGRTTDNFFDRLNKAQREFFDEISEHSVLYISLSVVFILELISNLVASYAIMLSIGAEICSRGIFFMVQTIVIVLIKSSLSYKQMCACGVVWLNSLLQTLGMASSPIESLIFSCAVFIPLFAIFEETQESLHR